MEGLWSAKNYWCYGTIILTYPLDSHEENIVLYIALGRSMDTACDIYERVSLLTASRNLVKKGL